MRKYLQTLFIFFVTTFGCIGLSHAGQWSCEAGLGGTNIVSIKMEGSNKGKFGNQAQVSVVGYGGGAMSVHPEMPEAGEMARAMVGAETQSKLRLRVMQQELAPGRHPIFVLMVNMAIPKELDGFCQFSE